MRFFTLILFSFSFWAAAPVPFNAAGAGSGPVRVSAATDSVSVEWPDAGGRAKKTLFNSDAFNWPSTTL